MRTLLRGILFFGFLPLAQAEVLQHQVIGETGFFGFSTVFVHRPSLSGSPLSSSLPSGGRSPDGRSLASANEEDVSARCAELRRLLERAAETRGRIVQTLNDDPGFQSAKVLFVGEAHNILDVKEAFAKAIQPILAMPGTCLALEAPESLQKTLDRIQASDDPLKATEIFTRKVISVKGASVSSSGVEAAKKEHLSWIQMALDAKKAGNSVFAVDLDPFFDDPSEVSVDYRRHRRNTHMAQRIEKLLRSGKCEKVLSLNGMAHVYATRFDDELKSLPKLMEEKGIPHHSIYLEWRVTQLIQGTVPSIELCGLEPQLSPLTRGDYVLSGKTSLNGFFSQSHFKRTAEAPQLIPLALDGNSSILIFSRLR